MSVMYTKAERQERQRQQSETRRGQRRAIGSDDHQRDHNDTNPAPAAVGENDNKPDPAAQTDDSSEASWRNYLKFARKLYRRGELEKLGTAIREGNGPELEDCRLMQAAILLAPAKIGRWLPTAPTAEQLADPEAWVAKVMEDYTRRSQNVQWERELEGLPRNGGGVGKPIGPARLQKSKYDKEELFRRLRFVIAEHKEKHGGFERRYLDHRSPYYISAANGGISNKQVTFLANEIVGNTAERSFDQNWTIVCKELAEEVSSPQPITDE